MKIYKPKHEIAIYILLRKLEKHVAYIEKPHNQLLKVLLTQKGQIDLRPKFDTYFYSFNIIIIKDSIKN